MYRTLRIFIIFKLSLCGTPTQAQFVYFDSLYDSGVNRFELSGSGAVIEYEQGIYSIAAYSQDLIQSNGSGQIFYFEIDNNGNRIREFLIENEIAGQHDANGFVILSDTVAITASSFVNTQNHKQQSLTQFNKQSGELIWRKYYGSISQRNYCTDFIRTKNGGYALTGQSVDSVDAQIPLIKTDNLGNLEWEKYYGGAYYEAAHSLIQTPDKGFLILGYTQSMGVGHQDFYLVKTDSVGNLEWQKTYGSSTLYDVGWGIVFLQDSNYLLSGGAADGNGNGSGKLIKINNAGTMIWQKNYSYSGSDNNFLYWSKELPDGSFITAGGTNNFSQGDAGWLVKTDGEGSLIWERKFNKNEYTDLFYGITHTSDNGFLLNGHARNLQSLNTDVWLLKVDSMGCQYPNCTVGIDENDNTKVVADIWPNPAGEVLNIEFQNADDWQITLTDVNGKVVYETTDHGRLTTVNTSTFSNGIYLLQLVSDGSVVNKKIVVQH